KEEEIEQLMGMVRDHFRQAPNVVEIPGNHTYFVGDLHGDLGAARSIRDILVNSDKHSMVFLGDYVDRGSHQIETVNLVLALALAYPDRVTVLRGNHESEEVSTRYGFFMAVSRSKSDSLFQRYCDAFQELPLAGLSKNGVFAVHGGVPEDVTSLEAIQSLNRRFHDFPDPTAFQLVWNDPREGNFRFKSNMRGGRAREFGDIAFEEFSANLGIRKMFRAHEALPKGVTEFFGGRLISVFSTPYGGRVSAHIALLENNYNVSSTPI
ncbi:MAG: metallophosphoesterase, partial [Candidatus Thorarchaeota archaeon]